MPAGVFCLENWSGRLTEHSSVRPLLDFMAPRGHGLRYIHRTVDSGDQLDYYFDRWSWLKAYPLGYLALHGERGHLRVGNDLLSLERLLRYSHQETPPDGELTSDEIASRDARSDHDWIAGWQGLVSRFVLDAGGARPRGARRGAGGNRCHRDLWLRCGRLLVRGGRL